MLTHVTDHQTRAKKKLLVQLRGKPNLEDIVDCLAAEIQELEDSAYALVSRLDVDAMRGVQLDGLGSILGLSRYTAAVALGFSVDLENPESDTKYRLALKLQKLVNTSKGKNVELFAILQAYFDDALADTQLVTIGGGLLSIMASFEITADDATWIRFFFGQAASATVSVVFSQSEHAETAPDWAFDGLLEPERVDGIPRADGYGDKDDPDIGGAYVTALDI